MTWTKIQYSAIQKRLGCWTRHIRAQTSSYIGLSTKNIYTKYKIHIVEVPKNTFKNLEKSTVWIEHLTWEREPKSTMGESCMYLQCVHRKSLPLCMKHEASWIIFTGNPLVEAYIPLLVSKTGMQQDSKNYLLVYVLFTLVASPPGFYIQLHSTPDNDSNEILFLKEQKGVI